MRCIAKLDEGSCWLVDLQMQQQSLRVGGAAAATSVDSLQSIG
jgi:Tfp pilus assembly protein PilN